MKHSNQLIHETSPYLLQHAHNPVNWHPWGEEALEKAKKENKPILVSIGYAACHWCHVMERESFEDETTAAMMNEHFINIKIDREERPDLDHIYMDAVQAMTGSGGWPLNVFLTPDAKPFYGGTYFPPKKAFNRPSWQETLMGVIQAFKERRHEIDAQAENLTDHLLQANNIGKQQEKEANVFTQEKKGEIVQHIMKQADKEWGGFGRAPKFPQTFSIQFLLRYAASLPPEGKTSPRTSFPTFDSSVASEGGVLDSDTFKDFGAFADSKNPPSEGMEVSLSKERGWGEAEQALLSLDKMIEGGIYDQAGGGFARYSTDTEWLAPHFEKMLYDNALLVSVISEAYQLTGKDRYKEVIEETMEFVEREMLDKSGGFFSALDADSEGVEGKFYVWSRAEVDQLLGKDAPVFCGYYDITENGNWDKTNILRVKKPAEIFAREKGLPLEDLKELLSQGRKKLLGVRNRRIRPLLDDKIILGWNALMNTACCKAFAATGKERYRQLAIDNMQFLLKAFPGEKGNKFHHTWKNGVSKYPAFLDDLAFLIEALVYLQEITADRKWLLKAKEITGFVLENFKEEGTGFFFYTPVYQQDVIIRKKEIYDGAVPSGNSVMAWNLYRLGILFDLPEWKEQSLAMTASLGKVIGSYPTSFGNWAGLLMEIADGTNEIAVIGESYEKDLVDILKEYIPNRVLVAAYRQEPAMPLLSGKTGGIWLCRNYTCQLPVFSAKELISLINSTPTTN